MRVRGLEPLGPRPALAAGAPIGEDRAVDHRAPRLPEYEAFGEGPPILMLPGMEGGTAFWRPQMEALAAGHRVVTCSYPRRRPSRSARIADYVADVLLLVEHLGLDRFALFGESFGGVIAQELAIAHPQRIAALALCNTVDRPRRGGLGLNLHTVATAVHPLAFVLPARPARGLLGWVGRRRGFVLDPSPGNAQLVEYILAHGLAPGLLGYADRIVAGMRARTTERLGAITAPTLVLRGAEDRLVGPETVLELVGRVPGAELALIDGGGHCCQLTRPEATTRALVEWLARVGYGEAARRSVSGSRRA